MITSNDTTLNYSKMRRAKPKVVNGQLVLQADPILTQQSPYKRRSIVKKHIVRQPSQKGLKRSFSVQTIKIDKEGTLNQDQIYDIVSPKELRDHRKSMTSLEQIQTETQASIEVARKSVADLTLPRHQRSLKELPRNDATKTKFSG